VLLIVVAAVVLGLGLLVVVPRLIPQLPPAEGMVRVERGRYTVGHDAPDNNHEPSQEREVAAFWIDQYEVTNAQYAKFVAETNAKPPEGWENGSPPAGKDDYPVEGITWDQAHSYCRWARKRLPSEAEWEVAARGPSGWLYPWGDDENAVPLPAGGTYPVGDEEKNISTFKVFDMAGNVWEWIDDPYASVEEDERVIRGGAHGFLVDMAHRVRGDPNASSMYRNAGVRCAASQVEGGE